MFNRLIIFIFIFLLSSCMFEPKYIKPDLPVDNNWPENIKLKNSSTDNINKISYKDFFKSKVLQQVIEEALIHNSDLRIAALNIELAQASYRIQRSNSLPNINLQFNDTRELTPKNLSSTPGEAIYSTNLNANIATTAFEIDLFGRVRSLNKAALENYFATEEARKATQISLIAEAANTYLQWLADIKTLKIANEILTSQEQYYNIVRVKYEKGISSKIDFMQAKTNLETAKSNQASFARTVDQDKTALILLVGSSNNKIFEDNKSFDQIELMTYLPVDLPSEVLSNRPDVMECEHKLKAQYANIGAARAAFFPQISLTASLGFANDSLTGLFSGGNSSAWSFIPQASLPIFTAGKNSANLKTAEISQQIAIVNYKKAIQTAFKEVADGLAAFRTINNQLKSQNELVKTAKISYDLSLARYKSGSDSFLNLIIAQQSYFLVQQNQILVKQQQYSNLINLYKALGGGI